LSNLACCRSRLFTHFVVQSTRDTNLPCRKVRNPMTKIRGLCLVWTATQTLEVLLWLQRLTHHGNRGSTGHSDKVPVQSYRGRRAACKEGTLLIDRERFTQARYSCLEPDRSVGKEPIGELSLSGEPECLSLQQSILPDQEKTGKLNRMKDYPGAQAPNKVGPPCPLWGFFP